MALKTHTHVLLAGRIGLAPKKVVSSEEHQHPKEAEADEAK